MYTDTLAPNTAKLIDNGEVQLQFLHYPYTLIAPTTDWNSLKIASVDDIACTKIQTIGARGSKKDFIDIYFLLHKYSLANLFRLLTLKYPKIDYNKVHLLKSLVYFEDAELQPMPRMHIKISWDQIKREIVKQVKSFQI